MGQQRGRDVVLHGVPAGVAFFLVLWLGSSWPIPADQLVYAQQAAGWDLTTRTVHLGWVLLLAVGGGGLALAAQALSAAVVVAGAGALRREGHDAISSWVVLAAVLPMAGVLEVDLLCAALVVLAAWDRHDTRVTVWLALALLVSPTALLALPWLILRSGPQVRRTPILAAVGIWLGVVTLAGGADWLVGERGLLAAPSWRLRPVLAAWVGRLPWLVLGGAALSVRGIPHRAVYGVLPLLAAPADVPVQLLATVMLVSERPRGVPADRVMWVLVSLQLAVSSIATHELWQQARARELVLRETARTWQPGDVVVAPWSVGVELSTMITGAAYGVPWRSEKTVLPRQEALWCTTSAERVHWWHHERFEIRAPSDPQVEDLLGCGPLER